MSILNRSLIACAAMAPACLHPAPGSAQVPLPLPPGNLEVGRSDGWQVFQSHIVNQYAACTIASRTTQPGIILTIRHSEDAPNLILLGFVRTDGKNWSKTKLSFIPTKMWINATPGDDDRLMVTNMRNVAVEHETSAALTDLATLASDKTALWISFDFPSSGEAVAIGMDGFPSALAAFKMCEAATGLPAVVRN